MVSSCIWTRVHRAVPGRTVKRPKVSVAGPKAPSAEAMWRPVRGVRNLRLTIGGCQSASSDENRGGLVTEHLHAHHGEKERSTAILDVSGLQWASEQNVVAARLGR